MKKQKLKAEKSKIKIYIIFTMILFISITLVKASIIDNSADADFSDPLEQCCIETNSGAQCQVVNPSECKSGKATGTKTCEQVTECKIGCCIDTSERTCSPQSLFSKCNLDNELIRWDNNNDCSEVSECIAGCCILGEKVEYITEGRCRKRTMEKGLIFNFKEGVEKTECLAIANSQELGACVLENKNCVFETIAECAEQKGTFNESLLCSNENLDTLCEKQYSIQCVEGKDEIYWFDSCGNRENIYDSDKDKSYNKGEILSKEDSCGFDKNNAGSKNCGNCNYDKGSICSSTEFGETSVDEGDFTCRNLDCGDIDRDYRENGESWCDYDGSVKFGTDVVGSRHWVKKCIDGKVEVEGCKDYRTEVCIQENTFVSFGKDGVVRKSSATCTPNRWNECMKISVNDYSNMAEGEAAMTDCIENPYCYVGYTSDFPGINEGDKGYPFLCLPNYPPGFNFNDTTSTNKDICGILTTTCDDSWCRTEEWTQQMNEICTSFGDCGLWPNIKGIVPPDPNIILNGESISMPYRLFIKTYANPKLAKAIGAVFSFGEFAKIAIDGGDMLMILNFFKAKNKEIIVFGPGEGRQTIPPTKAGWPDVPITACHPELDVESCAQYIGSGSGGSEVSFSCRPWRPPKIGGIVGGCEKCNEDPDKPCTQYRCSSIGRTCIILNDNLENPVCVQSVDDKQAPDIFKGKIENHYSFENPIPNEEIDIEYEERSDRCVPEFTTIQFSLKTNEYAQCKWDFEEKDSYDEMSEYFNEGEDFAKEHELNFSMPSIWTFENEGELLGDLKTWFANTKIHVRCQDHHANGRDYIVNLCVNSAPDIDVPEILNYNPESGSYFAYGENEKDLTIYLNEPAECKYSNDPEIDYDSMSNSMDCKTKLNDWKTYGKEIGWPCSTTLTGLIEDENIFYIKCKDKPWVKTQADITKYEERNVNTDDFEYILYNSESKLKIESVSPQNEITVRTAPVSVDLEVITSGGMDNGKSICYYSKRKDSLGFQLGAENSNIHSTTLSILEEGEKIIWIKCEDEAGNIDSENSTLNIKFDNEAPIIVRAFQEGGNLKLITNEEAKCYYDFTNCDFDLENASSMTTAFDKTHFAEWNLGKTYHVKCEDILGTSSSGCAMIIEPSKLELK